MLPGVLRERLVVELVPVEEAHRTNHARNASRPANARHWRYLFNRLGELAAVRDPRGCGQDFFYDRAGRLVGEDYLGCGEAQDGGELGVGVVTGTMGMAPGTSREVDVLNHYDVMPDWVAATGKSPPTTPALLGRATGSTDRAQRSAVSYDVRGNVLWSARQVAVLPAVPAIALTRSGDAPTVDELDAPTDHAAPVYDRETYVSESRYDGAGRAFRRLFPEDPDWSTFLPSGDTTPAPVVEGRLAFNDRGLPTSATVHIGGETRAVLAGATYDAWGAPSEMRLRAATAAEGILQSFTYDVRHRPYSVRVERGSNSGVSSGTVATSGLNAVRVPFHEVYDWDRVSNLMAVTSYAGPEPFPAGHRQSRRTVAHDSLYRVAQVAIDYLQDDLTFRPDDAATDYRDERTRPNDDALTHEQADPMRSRPAAMLPPMPGARMMDLTYEYDWLANQVTWDDDARSFFERSIGRIGNGAGHADGRGDAPALRPSALYVASNLPTSGNEALEANDGWLDVDYGESGNVAALTVRAQCLDRGANRCIDDPSLSPAAREAALLAHCTCTSEQHYEYRWDELNRLSEARRYDRSGGSGDWTLAARQRTRYDGGNQRIVKESLDPQASASEPERHERVHLYVLPGDFERAGVRAVRDVGQEHYEGSVEQGTETEYHVAGATLVHKPAELTSTGLRRERRLTMALRDLIGTASAVVDLDSGHLVEMATFTPNGARETHWMTSEASLAPERSAFTGKEEDEEVGVTYFGERYLIARIGRWATPDPLSVHAVGGGEVGNAYHYVSGNVLQGRDPVGLECGVNESCADSDPRAEVQMPDGSGRSARAGGPYGARGLTPNDDSLAVARRRDADEAARQREERAASEGERGTAAQVETNVRLTRERIGPPGQLGDGTINRLNDAIMQSFETHAPIITALALAGPMVMANQSLPIRIPGLLPRSEILPIEEGAPAPAPEQLPPTLPPPPIDLTARAIEIRDALVTAGVVHPSPAIINRFPVGVTEANVPNAPRIVTVGSQAAWDAIRSGRVQLQPGEELGPPPRFEGGRLLPESHVEALGVEYARGMYGASGGRTGTTPRQCATCAEGMQGSGWEHTNPRPPAGP